MRGFASAQPCFFPYNAAPSGQQYSLTGIKAILKPRSSVNADSRPSEALGNPKKFSVYCLRSTAAKNDIQRGLYGRVKNQPISFHTGTGPHAGDDTSC